jgi:hypothetical protein
MLTFEYEKKINEKRKKTEKGGGRGGGGEGGWPHVTKSKELSSMVYFSPFLHTTNSKVFALFAQRQNMVNMTTPMIRFVVLRHS